MEKPPQKIIRKKQEEFLMEIWYRLSGSVSLALAKTRITPNQITILNFVILTPAICYFFILGGYLFNFIALGLILLSAILDLCDGTVARLKSLQSRFGAWLDGSLDKIHQFAIFIAVIVGVVAHTGNQKLYVLGLILLLGQSMMDFMSAKFEQDFNFDGYHGIKDLSAKLASQGKIKFRDSFLKNVLNPTYNFVYLFLFTVRYWLVLAIIFNRLDVFLWVFAITINVRWLAFYFLYAKYLSGRDSKLGMIKILRDIKPLGPVQES